MGNCKRVLQEYESEECVMKLLMEFIINYFNFSSFMDNNNVNADKLSQDIVNRSF